MDTSQNLRLYTVWIFYLGTTEYFWNTVSNQKKDLNQGGAVNGAPLLKRENMILCFFISTLK